MGEHEPGPLEREISDEIRREVSADPTALEMLTGQFDEAAYARLSPEERRLRLDSATERILRAHRAAILRIAHEIDTIKASSGGGQ